LSFVVVGGGSKVLVGGPLEQKVPVIHSLMLVSDGAFALVRSPQSPEPRTPQSLLFLLEDEKDGPSIVSENSVSAIWPRTSARLAGNAVNDDDGDFVAIPVTAGPRWTNDEMLPAQNHDRRRETQFDPSYTENVSDCRFAPIRHRVNTR
jgi:hypothetical protein